MERSWYWRLALVIGLIVGGLYVAAPSFIYLTSSPDVRRSKKLLAEKMPEGLPQLTDTKLDLVRACRADLLARWTASCVGQALDLEFVRVRG